MKISMFQAICGAVANVLINLILIPKMLGMGAAIATVFSYAVSGVFENLIFRDTRPMFYLQMKTLRLAWLPDFISMTYGNMRKPSNA